MTLCDFGASERDATIAVCVHKQEPGEPWGAPPQPGGKMHPPFVFTKTSPRKPAERQQRYVYTVLQTTAKVTARQRLMEKAGTDLHKSYRDTLQFQALVPLTWLTSRLHSVS